MTGHNDLRAWLAAVEKAEQVIRIERADWNQEIGCIVQLNRRKDAPALLFDNIKDYPPGYRILSSSLKTPSRVSFTLNLPVCHSDRELLGVLREKLPDWDTRSKEFPPEVVDTGPILENIHSGRDVDLFEFPVPKWNELDGGRYIGTADAVITRDPDTGEVNLGTYRIMAHDERTTALYISPGHHGRIHYERYHQRGQPCPVLVSVGHHPLIFAVASLPLSGPEYPFAGAIRGEPVGVIIEEVTGLPMPAHSEIVIAGWSPPDKTRLEGPFGEWTGYYASKEIPAPIIEVERVYHRNNPIMLGSCPSHPPGDSTYHYQVLRSALLHNELARSGIPDVKGVWFSEMGGHTFIVVSIKQRYAGHTKQAALFVCQSPVTFWGRYVVVVDEDIDPTNTNDVLWALCFRTDPEKDIDIIRRTWSTPLDPMIRKPADAFFSSRAIIDACKPYEWMQEFPREVKPNPKLEEKVKEKWGSILKL